MTINSGSSNFLSVVLLLIAISCPAFAADPVSARRSPSAEEIQRLWPQSADFLPRGYRPAKSAKLVKVSVLGKQFWYFDQIEWISKSNLELPVRFRLIAGDSNPRPFYLMEFKVWYDLFRQFSLEHPNTAQDSKWQKLIATFAEKSGMPGGKLPIFEVTFDRAQAFAKSLGGEIPTREQWDRAAGWQPDKTQTGGPFRAPMDNEKVELSIGRNFPCRVDEYEQDVSPTGCRQMAGNGKEWTRDVFVNEPKKNLWLRGRSFTAEKPLLYSDFRHDQFGSQDAETSSYTVGFRVVLEIK